MRVFVPLSPVKMMIVFSNIIELANFVDDSSHNFVHVVHHGHEVFFLFLFAFREPCWRPGFVGASPMVSGVLTKGS